MCFFKVLPAWCSTLVGDGLLGSTSLPNRSVALWFWGSLSEVSEVPRSYGIDMYDVCFMSM